MSVNKYVTANLVQADGATVLEMQESGFTSQLTVGGTATSGTLAFEYKNNGKWFNLNMSGSQLVINVASNSTAYILEGCFDAIRVTPTSIAGGYYVVEVISEVM